MDDVEAAAQVVAAHRAAGSFFAARGVGSFVRAEGDGEPVVLMHGLPASSFLYRKVIPELAARGYRALSFDLPGLGLADRPADFDYTLRGLGSFAAEATKALGLERFHLVVHDAGGPIGFELALQRPEAVRSLTILNTMLELPSLPFPGEVYARFATGVGGPMTAPGTWRRMLYRVGVADRGALSMPEILAWRDLALGSNEGATYLEIMRHVREGHEAGRYAPVVDSASAPYPIRIVWGGLDPILSLRRFAWRMLAASRLPSMTVLPAKHFLQEDCAPEVAALVAENAASGS